MGLQDSIRVKSSPFSEHDACGICYVTQRHNGNSRYTWTWYELRASKQNI